MALHCSHLRIISDIVSVDAITSGMREGLTLVVGPPGTGKTDVAVQIISNLYLLHSFVIDSLVIKCSLML